MIGDNEGIKDASYSFIRDSARSARAMAQAFLTRNTNFSWTEQQLQTALGDDYDEFVTRRTAYVALANQILTDLPEPKGI